ncbi:resuscitation-promoting factor [Actinomyces sp. MRS3W]|uniref:resuscitation-promoting factor n=1 Tax=Actinomyces sp. MRS3W TaxID=2800796 RepID=UPI0028FD72CC|nr:transglycosylase family protein [Actinomyces sp. MRS3W]MDU0348262.1 transglycosylase family protein [Actinomyces sp. MRS3W]
MNDLLQPTVLRAGGIAAVLALSISGGAYAAVQATTAPDVPATEAAMNSLNSVAVVTEDADIADVDLVVSADTTEVSSVTEDVTDEFERVEQETDALAEGETEVETEGVNGVTRVVYRVTSVGGEEVAREVVSRVVVSERVDEVVLVGTGTASDTTDTEETATSTSGSSDSATSSQSTSSASAADGSVWAALAQCESGGNPTTNTGNGFYGLYQFSLPTWRALGGTGYPHEADAATQTAMAQKLQAQSGWGQWPHCAAKLGLL